MTENNKVTYSIIIPVYNVEQYIKICIESILKTTVRDYEIILVDDGSTDNSPKICDGYSEKFSQIRVIHKKNGRQTSARKAGLMDSKGDYILFIDSDDFVSEDYLNEIDKVVRKYQPDVILFNFYYHNTNQQTLYSSYLRPGLYQNDLSTIFSTMILNECRPKLPSLINPALWNKCWKKELIYKYQMMVPETFSHGEDLVVTYPTLLKANRMYYLQKPLYFYRVNPTSITHTPNNRRLDEEVEIDSYIRTTLNRDEYNLNEQLNYLSFNFLKVAASTFYNFSSNVQEYSVYLDHEIINTYIKRLELKELKKLSLTEKLFFLAMKRKKMKLIYNLVRFKYLLHI